MSEALDLDYIQSVVQEVLVARFPEGERRHIVRTDKDFTFACPVCGDSAKDNRKKRGHLYYNTMLYRCFNDGCKSSFTSLAKKYDVTIDVDKKNAIIAYLESNVVYRSARGDDYVMAKLDKLITIENLQAFFDSGQGFLRGFRLCRSGDVTYTYMLKRGFPPEFIKENIYTAVHYITSTWKEPVIVFLNRTKEKVLGLQIRNLKEGKQRTFKIYNFEALYNMMYEDEPLDEMEAIGYNKLSYLFDVMNVDYERPVTVFEGYLDSRFFPNSIGAVGTNTDFNFFIQNELPVRFFFDNDEAGHKKALEYMNMGHSVFLWRKLFEDCATRQGNYFNNMKLLAEVKDLNKLALAIPNPYNALKLEKYFSQDAFDKQWIPKYIYKKKNAKKEQRIAEVKTHIETEQWDYLKNLVLKR